MVSANRDFGESVFRRIVLLRTVFRRTEFRRIRGKPSQLIPNGILLCFKINIMLQSNIYYEKLKLYMD